MNILKYTNGVGHLIMSLATLGAGLALVLVSTDSTLRGLGVALILTVQGAWFIPGSAKQVATEVVQQVAENTTNGTPPQTPIVSPPAVVAAPKGAQPRG